MTETPRAGNEPQPSNAPTDSEVRTVPLEDDESGTTEPLAQENVGRDNMAGGGEWPSKDAPATGPSPGAVGAPIDRRDEPDGPSPYEQADEGTAASGSVG